MEERLELDRQLARPVSEVGRGRRNDPKSEGRHRVPSDAVAFECDLAEMMCGAVVFDHHARLGICQVDSGDKKVPTIPHDVLMHRSG